MPHRPQRTSDVLLQFRRVRAFSHMILKLVKISHCTDGPSRHKKGPINGPLLIESNLFRIRICAL